MKKLRLIKEPLCSLSEDQTIHVVGAGMVTTVNPRVCDTDTAPSGLMCGPTANCSGACNNTINCQTNVCPTDNTCPSVACQTNICNTYPCISVYPNC